MMNNKQQLHRISNKQQLLISIVKLGTKLETYQGLNSLLPTKKIQPSSKMSLGPHHHRCLTTYPNRQSSIKQTNLNKHSFNILTHLKTAQTQSNIQIKEGKDKQKRRLKTLPYQRPDSSSFKQHISSQIHNITSHKNSASSNRQLTPSNMTTLTRNCKTLSQPTPSLQEFFTKLAQEINKEHQNRNSIFFKTSRVQPAVIQRPKTLFTQRKQNIKRPVTGVSRKSTHNGIATVVNRKSTQNAKKSLEKDQYMPAPWDSQEQIRLIQDFQ